MLPVVSEGEPAFVEARSLETTLVPMASYMPQLTAWDGVVETSESATASGCQ